MVAVIGIGSRDGNIYRVFLGKGVITKVDAVIIIEEFSTTNHNSYEMRLETMLYKCCINGENML